MIYVIENYILFNMDENTLVIRDNSEEKVVISNPARRILALLIEQQGIVVMRETLFQKVWDDYGLISSNNNLNHCISKLRKVISSLGITSELIVTVPKVGFLLKKEIDVKIYCESDILEKSLSTPLPPVENTLDTVKFAESTNVTVNKKDIGFLKSPLIIYVLGCLILSLLSSVIIIKFDRQHILNSLFVATLGECNVYSSIPIPVHSEQKFIESAKSFIGKKKVSCQGNDIIVFHTESLFSPIDTGSSREFMAKCEVGNSHNIELCVSYYSNDRKFDD